MTTQPTFSIEAIAIANELLAKSRTNKNGRYWPSCTHQVASDVATIYSGNAGIGLFFLELYKQTTNPTYLQSAIETTDWLFDYCSTHPSTNYSFLKGRMGIAYLAAKLFEVTEEEKYLWQTLSIVQNCSEFLQSPTVKYNYLEGTAGTLLALLHIHKMIDEPLILAKIDEFIGHLLDGIQVTPTGIYWPNQPKFPQGQCGFAQGSAGISFVFLELGYYFDNETFFWVAEQALIYDTTFYHQCLIDGQEVAQYSLSSIGISRLRAYDLLKKNVYRKEALSCINESRNLSFNPFAGQALGVHHGSIGHAELLIDSFSSFCDIANLYNAQQIAYGIIDNKHHYLHSTNDCGLFSGKAGLGYFYLRLMNPEMVDSPLCPTLKFQPPWITDADTYPNITIFQSEVTQKIVEKNFGRTFNLLIAVQPDEVIDYLSEDMANPTISFRQFVDSATHLLEDDQKEWIRDIFQLEKTKHKLQGYIYEAKTTTLSSPYTETFIGNDFLGHTLKIVSTAKIVTTQWDWSINMGELDYELSPAKTNKKILLAPTNSGIVEQPLCNLSSSLLEGFCGQKTVEAVINGIINEIQLETNMDKDMIYKSLLTQLEEFINLGVLVPH